MNEAIKILWYTLFGLSEIKGGLEKEMNELNTEIKGIKKDIADLSSKAEEYLGSMRKEFDLYVATRQDTCPTAKAYAKNNEKSWKTVLQVFSLLSSTVAIIGLLLKVFGIL
jgi:hypothetical protein